MSKMQSQWMFLLDLADLIRFIEVNDFSAVGGELKRGHAEQQRLYDLGLSKAKPGESRHQHLQAIDIEIFDEFGKWLKVPDNKDAQKEHRAKLQIFGDYWESLDERNRWGGNWTFYDPNHFERGK